MAEPKILKFKKLDETLPDPAQATDGSAGYDLCIPYDMTLDSRHITEVPLRIAVQIPKGWVGLLRPRSGMGREHGISMAVSGIIDSDYRGELVAYVKTHHNMPVQVIERGTSVFQLVVVPCLHAKVQIVDKLTETKRGSGGFGSTDEENCHAE